jgi:uncharacterized glyoxalase superfamily protein PhnB
VRAYPPSSSLPHPSTTASDGADLGDPFSCEAEQMADGLVLTPWVSFGPGVDAQFAEAKAAGAYIGSEPSDQEYGLRDPENHRWWFSSPLAG